jgi:isocitrate/isopropylmalate dehydrogenase
MYRIAVLPGDGTGPEVIREGLKVLAAAADGVKYELTEYDGGERYPRTGEIRRLVPMSCAATTIFLEPSATRTWRQAFSRRGCCCASGSI